MSTMRTRLPLAWNAAHYMQQGLLLLLAAIVFTAVSWDSPVYRALLAGFPTWVVPPGIPVPSRLLVPFLVPVLLGLPLVFGRQHVLTSLWLAVMALLLALAVIEVSRLNWGAFVSGVAFRIESGPVPFLRTLGGLVVLLVGLLLAANRSVRESLRHFAERGIPLRQLVPIRRQLLALERLLSLALLAAGSVLTLVALISMSLTEVAPEPQGSPLLPLAWTGLLIALVAAGLALGAWRRQRTDVDGQDRPRPPR